MPVLIFGVAASTAVVYDMAAFRTPFLLTLAMTLAAAAISPIATAAALRNGID